MQKEFEAVFLCKFLIMKWRFRQKRNGQELSMRNRNKLRYVITACGQFNMINYQEKKAFKVLKQFFCLSVGCDILIRKQREFMKSIVFM